MGDRPMHELNRTLDKDEIQQFLTERQTGEAVHFYRTLRAPGGKLDYLGWLKKEGSDQYAVYGGRYEGGSVDTAATVELLQTLAPGGYVYEGRKTEL